MTAWNLSSGGTNYSDSWINTTIDQKILDYNETVVDYVIWVNSTNTDISYSDSWINTTIDQKILDYNETVVDYVLWVNNTINVSAGDVGTNISINYGYNGSEYLPFLVDNNGTLKIDSIDAEIDFYSITQSIGNWSDDKSDYYTINELNFCDNTSSCGYLTSEQDPVSSLLITGNMSNVVLWASNNYSLFVPIGLLTGNITEIRTDINNNYTKVTTLMTNNATLFSTWGELSTNISNVRTDIDNNYTKVTTLMTNNATLSATWGELSSNISNVNTRISGNSTLIRTDIDNNYTKVTTLMTGNMTNTSQWLVNGNNIYNKNSGHVGIGTSTPNTSYTLDTSTNANAAGSPSFFITGKANKERLIIYAFNNTVGGLGTSVMGVYNGRNDSNYPVSLLAGDSIGVYQFGGSNINSSTQYYPKRTAWIQGFAAENFDATTWGSDMAFFTTAKNNQNTIAERMRITSEGRVGINTTAPVRLFEVVGDANITGTTYTTNLATWAELSTNLSNVRTDINNNWTKLNILANANYSLLGGGSETLWTGNESLVNSRISGNATSIRTDINNNYTKVTTLMNGNRTVNVTTFTSIGNNTWVNPGLGTSVKIQMWAAGGSGGRGGAADAGGGGGGGGYYEIILPLAQFSLVEYCSVGKGGPSCTSDECNGIAGSNTNITVGTSVYKVYGGAGGIGVTTTDGGGGGGGGIYGAGQSGTTAAGGLGGIGCTNGGVGTPVDTWGGDCGGGGGTTNGGSANWGGGGGGFGQDNGISYSGGYSNWGGGGGGGGDGTAAPDGIAGVSIYGGNGGIGSTATTAAGNGTQPAGGGGGSESADSGAGGDGKCIITVW